MSRESYRARTIGLASGLVCGLAGCNSSGAAEADASGMEADTSRDMTSVNESVVVGNVAPCAPGFAHPSVCCHSGPQEPTVCAENVSAPFGRCGGGSLTFPDPRICCSLVRGAPDCAPATMLPGDSDAGVLTEGCHLPCGPGGYPPGDAASFPACTDVPGIVIDGGILLPGAVCEYCCVGDPGSCPGSGVSCLSPDCPPVTFGCGSCPEGWQPARGVPDLCCRADGGTSPDCFSQAAWTNGNGLNP
jgi:hypothetical protein